LALRPFIDTSALVALEEADDVDQTEALRVRDRIRDGVFGSAPSAGGPSQRSRAGDVDRACGTAAWEYCDGIGITPTR
jgi:hypothetical protein